MAELIWVVPADPVRVALAEEHEDHPGGLAWVAGCEVNPEKAKVPVQIARTEHVERKLARGDIKLVPDPKPKRRRRAKAKVPPEPEADNAGSADAEEK